MNQRQHEADRNRREAGRYALVRRSKNHDQEHEGQHELGDECRRETVAARRMRAVAVRGEPAAQVEACRAARDHVQHTRREDSANHLRDDVRQHFVGRKSLAGPQSDRHRGIDVTAGNRADREGHREQRQAERERYPQQADSHFGKACGNHGGTASAENEPEGADQLRCETPRHAHGRPPRRKVAVSVQRYRADRLKAIRPRSYFLIASTSIEIATSSPTITPPVSSGWFHTMPKSLRLIRVVADAPARVLPIGSVIAAPLLSTSSTTGLVTPCSVRSPVTFHLFGPSASTLVDLKVMVGNLSTSRNAGLFK